MIQVGVVKIGAALLRSKTGTTVVMSIMKRMVAAGCESKEECHLNSDIDGETYTSDRYSLSGALLYNF